MFPNEELIHGSFDIYNVLSLLGGILLLSRCFSVKSLLYLNLRWFKFELAFPYGRTINLKQTVNMSLLMTAKSVARFYNPTRSS